MQRISRSNKKIIKDYVLVTGGSGDIGSEICKELSKLGHYSIMCYSKNFQDINKLKKNKFVIPLKIKLDSNNSINKAFKSLKSIIKKDDKFENIILCASPQPIILPILKCNSKEFLKHFKVSVIGHHQIISKIINFYFKRFRKGKILSILSKGIKNQKKPAKYMGPYLVAKSSLKTMLQIIKEENSWIKISNIYPSFIKTKMLSSLDKDYIKVIKNNEKILSKKEVLNIIIEKFQK
jgi:NAD(P)-dependent dehydrogenase (short-subunit alcohol dehydrogenase family)